MLYINQLSNYLVIKSPSNKSGKTSYILQEEMQKDTMTLELKRNTEFAKIVADIKQYCIRNPIAKALHIDIGDFTREEHCFAFLFEILFYRIIKSPKKIWKLPPDMKIYIELPSNLSNNKCVDAFISLLPNSKIITFSIFNVDYSLYEKDMNIFLNTVNLLFKAEPAINQLHITDESKESILNKDPSILCTLTSAEKTNLINKFINKYSLKMKNYNELKILIKCSSHLIQEYLKFCNTSSTKLQKDPNINSQVRYDSIEKCFAAAYYICCANTQITWETFDFEFWINGECIIKDESNLPIIPYKTSLDAANSPLINSEMRLLLENLYQRKNKKESDLCHSWIKKFTLESNNYDIIDILMSRTKFVFTTDNIFKMYLLYIRLKSDEPIIINGENGMGKTQLIKFFVVNVLQSYIDVFNVHDGITENKIDEYVDKIRRRYRDIYSNPDIIKFNKEINAHSKFDYIVLFDEFNSTKYVDVISDIIISKKYKGNLILKDMRDPNCLDAFPEIKYIGICLPFKTQQSPSKNIMSINVKKKHKCAFDLQYNVYKMPQSIDNYLWNFGSLSHFDEEIYISEICKSKLNVQCDGSKDYYKLFFNSVSEYHQLFKQNEGKERVGLRDISRLAKICKWFYNKFLPSYDKYRTNIKTKFSELENVYIENASKKLLFAMILSLHICYVRKQPIKNFTKDSSYIQPILKFMQIIEPKIKDCAFEFYFTLINNIQVFLLDQMKIKEKNIYYSSSLKESIFAMFVGICTHSPIILYGASGAGKSLSLQIISKYMKGSYSHIPFLKQFTSISIVYEVYNTMVSSKDIRSALTSAEKKNIHFRNQKVDKILQVVLFDNIRPFEQLQNSSITTIHFPTEIHFPMEIEDMKRNRLVFIALLNNKPDLALISRALLVSMPTLDNSESIEIAAVIMATAYEDHEQFEKFESLCDIEKFKEYSTLLVNGYLMSINKLYQNDKEYICSYGIKDIYSAAMLFGKIKKCLDICDNCKKHNKINRFLCACLLFYGEDKTLSALFYCIQRSFSRLSDREENLYLYICECISCMKKTNLNNILIPRNEYNLIEDNNFSNLSSRFTMIITKVEFYGFIAKLFNASHVIVCSKMKKDSDTDEYTVKKLGEIITYLRKDCNLFLFDIDLLKSKLENLFTKNFSIRQKKMYCKIPIRDNANKAWMVNSNFTCTSIINEEDIIKADHQFLNQFTKYYFSIDSLISKKEYDDYISVIEKWINNLFEGANNGASKLRALPIYSENSTKLLYLYYSKIKKVKISHKIIHKIQNAYIKAASIDFAFLLKENHHDKILTDYKNLHKEFVFYQYLISRKGNDKKFSQKIAIITPDDYKESNEEQFLFDSEKMLDENLERSVKSLKGEDNKKNQLILPLLFGNTNKTLLLLYKIESLLQKHPYINVVLILALKKEMVDNSSIPVYLLKFFGFSIRYINSLHGNDDTILISEPFKTVPTEQAKKELLEAIRAKLIKPSIESSTIERIANRLNMFTEQQTMMLLQVLNYSIIKLSVISKEFIMVENNNNANYYSSIIYAYKQLEEFGIMNAIACFIEANENSSGKIDSFLNMIIKVKINYIPFELTIGPSVMISYKDVHAKHITYPFSYECYLQLINGCGFEMIDKLYVNELYNDFSLLLIQNIGFDLSYFMNIIGNKCILEKFSFAMICIILSTINYIEKNMGNHVDKLNTVISIYTKVINLEQIEYASYIKNVAIECVDYIKSKIKSNIGDSICSLLMIWTNICHHYKSANSQISIFDFMYCIVTAKIELKLYDSKCFNDDICNEITSILAKGICNLNYNNSMLTGVKGNRLKVMKPINIASILSNAKLDDMEEVKNIIKYTDRDDKKIFKLIINFLNLPEICKKIMKFEDGISYEKINTLLLQINIRDDIANQISETLAEALIDELKLKKFDVEFDSLFSNLGQYIFKYSTKLGEIFIHAITYIIVNKFVEDFWRSNTFNKLADMMNSQLIKDNKILAHYVMKNIISILLPLTNTKEKAVCKILEICDQNEASLIVPVYCQPNSLENIKHILKIIINTSIIDEIENESIYWFTLAVFPILIIKKISKYDTIFDEVLIKFLEFKSSKIGKCIESFKICHLIIYPFTLNSKFDMLLHNLIISVAIGYSVQTFYKLEQIKDLNIIIQNCLDASVKDSTNRLNHTIEQFIVDIISFYEWKRYEIRDQEFDVPLISNPSFDYFKCIIKCDLAEILGQLPNDIPLQYIVYAFSEIISFSQNSNNIICLSNYEIISTISDRISKTLLNHASILNQATFNEYINFENSMIPQFLQEFKLTIEPTFYKEDISIPYYVHDLLKLLIPIQRNNISKNCSSSFDELFKQSIENTCYKAILYYAQTQHKIKEWIRSLYFIDFYNIIALYFSNSLHPMQAFCNELLNNILPNYEIIKNKFEKYENALKECLITDKSTIMDIIRYGKANEQKLNNTLKEISESLNLMLSKEGNASYELIRNEIKFKNLFNFMSDVMPFEQSLDEIANCNALQPVGTLEERYDICAINAHIENEAIWMIMLLPSKMESFHFISDQLNIHYDITYSKCYFLQKGIREKDKENIFILISQIEKVLNEYKAELIENPNENIYSILSNGHGNEAQYGRIFMEFIQYNPTLLSELHTLYEYLLPIYLNVLYKNDINQRKLKKNQLCISNLKKTERIILRRFIGAMLLKQIYTPCFNNCTYQKIYDYQIDKNYFCWETEIAALYENPQDDIRLKLIKEISNVQYVYSYSLYTKLLKEYIYFDTVCENECLDKIVIELFNHEMRKTTQNFIYLCTGSKGISSLGKPLHYKNTKFYNIIGQESKLICGGDIQDNNGINGESVYGNPFEENRREIKISEYMIGMIYDKENKIDSRFVITLKKCFDKNVGMIGKVVQGINTIESISKMLNNNKVVKIKDCGEYM